MKGIFCHDLPIYKDVNGVYCSTTLTNNVFQRYFHIVDELIVATRVYSTNKTYLEMHQEKIDLPGIRFLDLPNVNKLSAPFKEIPYVKKWLIEEMKTVDVIIVRGGMVALLGVDAAKKLKKPYLYECAGCTWDAYWNHSLIGKCMAFYMEHRTKKDIKNADFVTYVTDKWLQSLYPTKGEGVALSDVVLSNTGREVLNNRLEKIKIKKESEPIVLGTTGGINVRYKGQQYVIQAIAKLKDRINFRYELVGGGDQTYLKSVAEKYGVQDKVVFKGQMKHDDVLKWLDTIDLYIQPSVTEGLPRALLEAMSRGCPAMGSMAGGIPELLEDKFLFQKRSVKGISELLLKLSKDDFIKSAERNFMKAKEYESSILQKRREEFFEKYRDYILDLRNKK